MPFSLLPRKRQSATSRWVRLGGDQQRAVGLERLAAAVEHEAGEAHIVGALGVEDGAAGGVAENGEAGHALEMGAGLRLSRPIA